MGGKSSKRKAKTKPEAKTVLYLGPDRRTVPRVCPTCFARLDAAFSAMSKPTDPDIREGDLSICAYCGTLAVVTATGLRVATTEEVEHLDPAAKVLLQHWQPGQRRLV